MIQKPSIHGEDEEDTRLLREMARRAEVYVRLQPWCLNLIEGRFIAGVGGIIALSLFKVAVRKLLEPEWIWIFTGDTPAVYLEFNGFESPFAALERYIEGLEDWVEAVDSGSTVDSLIPIDAVPTQQTADALRPRCQSLRELVLPWLSRDAVQVSN